MSWLRKFAPQPQKWFQGKIGLLFRNQDKSTLWKCAAYLDFNYKNENKKYILIINYGLASTGILKSMIENWLTSLESLLENGKNYPLFFEIGCCTKLVVEIKETEWNVS